MTALLREAARAARAARAGSLLVTLLTAIMVAAVLLTVGRSAAVQAAVVAQVADAGSRVLVIRDRATGNLPSVVLDRMARFSDVVSVIGLGDVRDVHNVGLPGGPAVSARVVYGLTAVPGVIAVPRPELRPGEAVVTAETQRTLRMAVPAGGLVDQSGAHSGSVVGAYREIAGAGVFGSGALVAAEPGPGVDLAAIAVVAERPGQVRPLTRQLLALLDPRTPDELTVEAPPVLDRLEAAIADELGTYRRSLLWLILAVELVLIGMTVMVRTLLERQGLGRRRALGATRGAIVTLVVLETLCAAVVGVVVGAAAGSTALLAGHAPLPPAGFTAAVCLLAVVCAALAAVAPALSAAHRDPVRVLRTP